MGVRQSPFCRCKDACVCHSPWPSSRGSPRRKRAAKQPGSWAAGTPPCAEPTPCQGPQYVTRVSQSVSRSVSPSVHRSVNWLVTLSAGQTVRQLDSQSARHFHQSVRQLVSTATQKNYYHPCHTVVSPAVVCSLNKAQLTACSLRQVGGSTATGVLLRHCAGNGHVRSHGGVIVQHVEDVAVADGLRWNRAVGVGKARAAE